MKRTLLTALIAVAMIAGAGNAAQWSIDQAHSNVMFKVKHMVISTVTGKFTDYDGVVYFDGELSDNDSVNFTVKTASVDTDNADRDDHLRNDDFFNAENYPEMKFVSKRITDVNGNSFKLVGDLTIRDVTKEVTFDCEFAGQVQDPWGNTKAGFTATTSIDRKEFGVNWSKALDTGGLVVSDNVEIILDLQLKKDA